jgi:hypothetical protein
MRKDLEQIIFKKKLKQTRQPKNDVEAVVQYLVNDNIKLTQSQDFLCTRLIRTDALIRSRKHTTDEIVEKLMSEFNITAYRAEQDMYDCHKVFGATRKLSKAYLVSHHIEEIGMMIKKCQEKDQLELLPKLFDNYTYALNSLPVEEDAKEAPPAQILFVLNGQIPVTQKSLAESLIEADNLLKPSAHGEYIEYDEEDSDLESASDDGADGAGE